MRPCQPETPRSQRGVSLIWMTLFLLVMLMFIALGIDMAKLMVTRSQLQNAADAAALAGATAFQSAGAAVEDSARARAIETASFNKAFENAPTPVVVDPIDVTVDVDSQTVKVTARREGGTAMVAHFLQVIGMKRLDVRATATAKAQGGCDLWPVAGRPDPGPEFVVGCTEYILKYGGGSGTQGSYGPLDLPDCAGDPCGNGGANRYRCELQNGYHCCIDSGTCIPSEQGAMSGPTVQGIEYRFNLDSDKREGICYTQYTGDPDAGPRIVWVPITTALGANGCSGYIVLRYGKFFLTRIPGQGNKDFIYANFMGYESAAGMLSGNFKVWLVK